MNTKKVGEFLKELRKENKLTQEQLGEKLGVTNKTVSKWETGNYMPPIEILKLLSELYNVSINEILSGRRLSDGEYKEKAEENMTSALEKLASREKRWYKIFVTFLIITTIIAIITMELVSGLSGSAVVKVIIVLLVMALAFVSNVLNMCLYISEKEKNKFSDKE